MPKDQREVFISHCLRKLNQKYLEHESKERKAYGLIGGRVEDNVLCIGAIAPLYKNSREHSDEKRYMDEVLGKHAQASETPLPQRGWVADADETINILGEFGAKGLELIAAYHMHRVPWENDPTRETPTELDTVLAEGSGLFTFIIATINPDMPVIRAFYEGYIDQELPIVVV